jgi:hypothetical protein
MPTKTPRLVGTILAFTVTVVSPALSVPQGVDWNGPAIRQELRGFRQFLANHPWIADQLKDNAALANDPGFLRRAPELPPFLNAHPFVQASLKVDASGVMSRAQVVDAIPQAEYDREALNFNRFLAIHAWTADKLKSSPALANDNGFLKGDIELQEFLNASPFAQAQIRSDANGYLQLVENLASGDLAPGSLASQAYDVAALRAFLQNHPWIADKLKDDPTRANNKVFLTLSKELRQFLDAHPFVQDQFKQDPRRTIDLALQPSGQYF